MIADNKTISDTEVMLGELDRIVSEEMKKKPSKRDDALIDECIAEMAKLKNVRAGYTDEEIGAIMEKIQAKASGTSHKTPVRRKSVRRSIAAACAACLVLVCGVATVAWSPFSSLKMWFYELTRMSTETVVETNGITYTVQNETITYNTIKEFIENEHISIVYPSALPNGLRITNIDHLNINGTECINIYFNDPNTHYIVQFDTPLYLNVSEYDIIEANDMLFYLSYQNDKYIARAYINSDLYLIECSDYQDILTIINNCKKG